MFRIIKFLANQHNKSIIPWFSASIDEGDELCLPQLRSHWDSNVVHESWSRRGKYSSLHSYCNMGLVNIIKTKHFEQFSKFEHILSKRTQNILNTFIFPRNITSISTSKIIWHLLYSVAITIKHHINLLMYLRCVYSRCMVKLLYGVHDNLFLPIRCRLKRKKMIL